MELQPSFVEELMEKALHPDRMKKYLSISIQTQEAIHQLYNIYFEDIRMFLRKLGIEYIYSQLKHIYISHKKINIK